MRKRVLSLCMALAMCCCSSLLPIPATALEVTDTMSVNLSEVVATTEVVVDDADWPIVGEDECVLENSAEALENDDTEGNAELLAGSVTSYSQLNSRWGSYNYRYSGQGNAGNTIARSGCGLLALTNAVYYLNGNFIEPTYLADFSADNGCHVSGGTVLSLYKTFCEQQGSSYGISYTGTIRGIDNLRTNLQKGYVAICTCSSSAGGHVMAIVDYDASNGKYLLLDSAPSSARGTYSNGYTWKTWSELTNIGVFSEFYVIQPRGTHTHQEIRKGSTGVCVRELQEMLNQFINAGLDTDGNFGSATESKLKEYQRNAGLTVDGVCGAATWAALERDVQKRPCADVGTDFCAYIINTTSWLHLTNDGDGNVTARMRFVRNVQTASWTLQIATMSQASTSRYGRATARMRRNSKFGISALPVRLWI